LEPTPKEIGDQTVRRTALALLTIASVLFFCLSAAAADDIQEHPSCKFCGMDRAKFAHSRMLIEYENGTSVATCSIHCAAVQFAAELDGDVKSILVGDYGTKRLIDAEKAYWVIGGKMPGVMTRNAKWAFATKDDAEKFVRDQGGSIASFELAMETTYKDMYHDTKMIRERRKQRKKEMGGHGNH
jgi:nitrous oxide reductase accessory protein NosL